VLEKVIVSWSSGKDSALALYEVMHNPEYDVIGLLTTINRSTNWVSMHNVHRHLVERQAASIGLPLEVVSFYPADAKKSYETSMRKALSKYQRQGVTAVVSGDIYLEDLRKNREDKLAQIGLGSIFPLWERVTRELAETLVKTGFRTVITSVDTEVLSRDYLGQVIDAQFLASLPAGVDPCGENGEYHSFVFDGPFFQEPVQFTLGKISSYEDRYIYFDLLPYPSI
jgi:uncharacterized protein (TIGR00290 family)